MKKLRPAYLGMLILTTLVLSACGANKSSSEGKLFRGDIVNGTVVTEKNKNAHSIVAIYSVDENNKSFICTGTIVSPEYILTAAHCVEKNTTNIVIVFSPDASLDTTKEKEIRLGDRVVQHSDWGKNLPSGAGDIALIHFEGTLPKGYSPVKLADESFRLKMAQKVLMVGYGVTNGKERKNSGTLRQTESVILGQTTHTEVVTEGKKSSVCYGDSGGPAFVKIGKDFVQWGIASTVAAPTPEKACTLFSVHTAIMSYAGWIKFSIQKMDH